MATQAIVRSHARPGPGRAGQPVTVQSNHFKIENVEVQVHQYDVALVPDVPPPVRRRLYEQLLRRVDTDMAGIRPVYDGRQNMFTPRELPFISRLFEESLPGDTERYKIKIRKVGSIDMAELFKYTRGEIALNSQVLAGIMALDVLIRHKPSLLFVAVGRSFFTPEYKKQLSGPLEVWRGFYQSARPTLSGMMINLDVSATAFFQSGPLTDIVAKILGLRSRDELLRTTPPLNWQKVERAIRGLRIITGHRGQPSRPRKIKGLSPMSAHEATFMTTGNGTESEITVETYFKETYQIRLRYSMLPCVVITQNTLLPLEMCFVVEGQRYGKKLDERQTADMIEFTCQSPHARANTIKQGLQILNYDNNEYLRDFGVKVSSEMVTIKGRLLPAPMVHYHPSSQRPHVIPQNGSWNLVGKKVVTGAILGAWGIVVFGNERDVPSSKVSHFVRELVVTCVDTGLSIVNKDPPISYVNPRGVVEEGLKKAWLGVGNSVKSQPQLLLCILPNTGVSLYAEIKRLTDTVIGVSSQCVQVKHTHTPRKQYCANVCLKINVKLGGMNSELAPTMLPVLKEKPTIIFGADVSHPAAGDSVRPSIAALVGSMDSKAARYATSIRIQTARTEVIVDLSMMVVELLKAFYQSCGQKPERIVFYRDGVSEGQFSAVRKFEVEAIKAGCRTLEEGYQPQVTFLVMQRGHHTRFFPRHSQDADPSGNCKSGLVVDTDIVHPQEFDFYLQSQASLLGTARPARYFVLVDENGFSPDTIQEFTFRLCHLQARCTQAVSAVPPAYYAHLVALRARFHSPQERWTDSGSTEVAEEARSYSSVRPELERVMWFM
ncbi:hypothetical protein BGX34_001112 [Mortierella sp. NVP85]|nr:hypothetical protein BGX34_001112 [Mortierella sp. NVP85]